MKVNKSNHLGVFVNDIKEAEDYYSSLFGFELVSSENEKISYKVRDHMAQKNPMVIVLGKKEIEDQSVNIRRLGNSETQEMPLKNFMKFISEEVKAPHHDL